MLERLQFELASSDDNKFKLPAAVASLDLGNAEVGGNSVGSGTLALLDTGNDRILVPNPEARLFHQWRGAFSTSNGKYGVPFNPTTIPPMSITVGSVTFPIDSTDIIGKSLGNGLCLSRIQDTAKSSRTLGVPFLKNMYQILDSDANETTLAKLK